eukprot:scaffold1815_cov208-Amphora_coffeaeformis.AAC.6
MVGVVVFFLLTRFEWPVPYAACMFFIGVCIGYGTLSIAQPLLREQETTTSSIQLDQLTESVLQWSDINSGVLLLVFLPGLIFRDAIEVDFSYFSKALPQLLLLAFPMVLVGTVGTAAISYYLLPGYDWPLALCATLGAILSSTDPVAVGSVLKSAGAPPRLQMHISGESLLNDGSAVVFFAIFSAMYLAEVSEDANDMDDVTWGQGIATFFRMSLGGTAVGFGFAAGLLVILDRLDRRLEPEYNVLQVVAALTTAYVSYYVSEQVCQMSGVIACVVCGITARALGRGLMTDNKMMDSYLALMEYLLNTLLFTLGGVVYGKAIRGTGDEYDITWTDFGYLLLFYVMIMVLRCGQVALFYPVFSRIGLQSNVAEAAFLGFGGLRGAVGVALALSLERSARESLTDPALLQWTRQVEFFAGGVTFLTLFVNGTAAGPVLKFLKLTKPTVSRKRTLKLFKTAAESYVNDECRKLLDQKRFKRAVKHMDTLRTLVPFLSLDVRPPPPLPMPVPPKVAVSKATRRERRKRVKAVSDGVAQMAAIKPGVTQMAALTEEPKQGDTPAPSFSFSPPSSVVLRAVDDSAMDESKKTTNSDDTDDTKAYASTPQEPLTANDTSRQSLVERRRARRARMKTLSDGVALMATMTAAMPSIDELASEVAAGGIATSGSTRPGMSRENSDRSMENSVRSYTTMASVVTTTTETQQQQQQQQQQPPQDPFARLTMVSQRSCPVEILQEVRGLYLDLLREAYAEEVSNNEMDEREDNGFNINLLRQSVAYAAADIDQQEPINDWEYTQNFPMLEDAKSFVVRQYGRFLGGKNASSATFEYQRERASVLRALLFIEAHHLAEQKLSSYVQSAMEATLEDDDATLMMGAIGIVVDESKNQVSEARAELGQIPAARLDAILTHHLATILLRRLADYVERRATDGFLTKKEARKYLDKIDQNIQKAHDGRVVVDEACLAPKDDVQDLIESQTPASTEVDF